MTPTPHYTAEGVTLYTGDAAEVLARLPAGSVDCLVTSPPYWGLRDYGTGTWTGDDPNCPHTASGPGATTVQRPRGGPVSTPPTAVHRGVGPGVCRRCGARRVDRQLGLEGTLEDYVTNLRGVFAQAARVLADDGTAWLNLGDSYAYGETGRVDAATHYPSLQRSQPPRSARRVTMRTGLRRKNLLGIPWRVALALQGDGWILRNAIVWHKPNAMPESVRDRLSCRYELVFLLTKSERYWFDLDPIRQPLQRPGALGMATPFGGRKGTGDACLGSSARRRGGRYRAKYADTTAFGQPHGPAIRPTGTRHTTAHPRGKNPGDVWPLATRPYKHAHFACYPIDLPLQAIAAGCRPGGTVLDPFSGAGTTALAAGQLGRPYIGIDLNPTFHDLAIARLAGQPPGTGATGAGA